MREMEVRPHLAENVKRSGGSAIDARTMWHGSYQVSQAKRRRRCADWQRSAWQFLVTAAAINLWWLPKVQPAEVRPEGRREGLAHPLKPGWGSWWEKRISFAEWRINPGAENPQLQFALRSPKTPITKSLTRITDLNYTFVHYEYYVQALSLSGSRRSSVIRRVQPSQTAVDCSRRRLQLHRQHCVRRGPSVRRRLSQGSYVRDLPRYHTKLVFLLKLRQYYKGTEHRCPSVSSLCC